MKSHEAYQFMIPRGDAAAHARALNVSESLIRMYRRPSKDGLYDTGKRSDLDRLAITMRTALGLGVPEKDALAGLHCLAQEFNHVCVRIPEPGANLEDQTRDVLKAMEEVGQYAAEYSKCLADGKLTDKERERVIREAHEAVAAIMASLQHCKPEVE